MDKHNLTEEEASQSAAAEIEESVTADVPEKVDGEAESATDKGHDVSEAVPELTERAPVANAEILSSASSTTETSESSTEMPQAAEKPAGPGKALRKEEPVTIETDSILLMSDPIKKITLGKELRDDSELQIISNTEFLQESEQELGIVKYPRGLIVSFFNVSYKVNLSHGNFFHPIKYTKEVLSEVSGIMKPGMNAIMGPLGCGKSTLLDILAARKDPSGLTGEVLIDGTQQPINFNRIAGYVVHGYMMTETLTVRENLEFSAALRLPKNVSKSERTKRVNRLIKDLRLTKIKDAKIGTSFTRGISDGEKKKTSIAMELIRDPGVLFLDEPTSGLDTSNANAVLQLLRRLARHGKTIIFSVHQPRYSMFKQFDSLTLLTNGKLMYHGPGKYSIDYFKAIGYKFQSHANPVDVLLDILCKVAENQADSGFPKLPATPETHHCFSMETENFESADKETAPTACSRLACTYLASSYFKELLLELEKLSSYSRLQQMILSQQQIARTTSFFHQLNWLCKRIFKKYLSDPRIPILTVSIGMVLCVILGCVFFRMKTNRVGIHNRAGLLFYIVNCQMYSSISSIELLVSEKKIFIHEYISGYYSLPAYFISKLLFDLMPLRTMPSVIYNSTTYFLVGLKRTVPAISISFLTLVMVSYTSSALALAVAAGGNAVTVGNIVLSLIFILMTVYSGLLVHLPSIVKWLGWLQYLSITRYGITALMVNEFVGLNFSYNVSDMGKGCHCPNPTPIKISCTGVQHLQDMGIGTTPWDLWQNHLGLGLLTALFLSTAYLKLAFMKKLS
ncbi:broad substrate specificity ATP-binding cassette transporter ABCG2-like [Scyliorhinus canicula]|uniref:broad substrate specificity ATP-binding cassette transporter ABCG2-like n=1 Tax=Scyliorhinus canicula TaxID=7830 RepID=UPI0018F63E64|nr:broad substrate specificity ATP-binding cassette transporter ABCG2-like [Scyliorhinus canicula]